jgi:hypothetical protein
MGSAVQLKIPLVHGLPSFQIEIGSKMEQSSLYTFPSSLSTVMSALETGKMVQFTAWKSSIIKGLADRKVESGTDSVSTCRG